MNPIFQLATPDDLEILLILMGELYAHEKLPFDAAVTRPIVQQLFGNEFAGQIYLIVVEAEIAGYVLITFGFSLEFRGRDAMLDELYLREPYRGRGLGPQTLQFVEQLCREQGICALLLEVERNNARALGIYRQAGYVERDRHLMAKWLQSPEQQTAERAT